MSRTNATIANGETASKVVLVCRPRTLPEQLQLRSAHTALRVNPLNNVHLHRLLHADPSLKLTPAHLALVIAKRWPTTGVQLTVGFLDGAPADLCARILQHMNAWAKTANVSFVLSNVDPQVRIARSDEAPNDGYWSYIGTEILDIDRNAPTLNLQGFTMQTEDSEFYRVVRHETGHTLGFPHEHMREELVKKIDEKKAIAYFQKYDNWSPEETKQQVLTPIEESSLLGTPHADPNSIMCYQIPGDITKDGNPIVGGLDIDQMDYGFAAQCYPKNTAGAQQKPSASNAPVELVFRGHPVRRTTQVSQGNAYTVLQLGKVVQNLGHALSLLGKGVIVPLSEGVITEGLAGDGFSQGVITDSEGVINQQRQRGQRAFAALGNGTLKKPSLTSKDFHIEIQVDPNAVKWDGVPAINDPAAPTAAFLYGTYEIDGGDYLIWSTKVWIDGVSGSWDDASMNADPQQTCSCAISETNLDEKTIPGGPFGPGQIGAGQYIFINIWVYLETRDDSGKVTVVTEPYQFPRFPVLVEDKTQKS